MDEAIRGHRRKKKMKYLAHEKTSNEQRTLQVILRFGDRSICLLVCSLSLYVEQFHPVFNSYSARLKEKKRKKFGGYAIRLRRGKMTQMISYRSFVFICGVPSHFRVYGIGRAASNICHAAREVFSTLIPLRVSRFGLKALQPTGRPCCLRLRELEMATLG